MTPEIDLQSLLDSLKGLVDAYDGAKSDEIREVALKQATDAYKSAQREFMGEALGVNASEGNTGAPPWFKTVRDGDLDALKASLEPTVKTFPQQNDGLAVQPPRREWIVDMWVPASRVCLVTGRGEAGKSRIMLQLALAMATGEHDWLGIEPGASFKAALKGKPFVNPTMDCHGGQTVVFATYEDEFDELNRRIQGMALGPYADGESHPPEKLRELNEAVGGRIQLISLMGAGPIYGPKGETGHMSTVADLTETGERLLMQCTALKPKLLVVDTLAGAFGSNENDRALVRSFVSRIDQWAQANNCAVVFIAHPPKSANVTYSGSSDWEGAPRILMHLRYEDSRNFVLVRHGHHHERIKQSGAVERGPNMQVKGLRFRVTKSNYALKPDPVWLDGWPRLYVCDEEQAVKAWFKANEADLPKAEVIPLHEHIAAVKTVSKEKKSAKSRSSMNRKPDASVDDLADVM